MERSSSDTESECFESAEESLDENNELESKKIKSENSCKNERMVAEPVFSNFDTIDSTNQLEENISNLSYRKRPERVKRILSQPPKKSISKSPSNEIIFNAEKMVSDVFFQDITSSLSKNINKRLNTLQQTSSNVKDLFLSSLPVSSINDNEGFSYDDKNVSSSIIEPHSNTQPSSQFSNQSDTFLRITEKVVENEEKDFEGKSTFNQTATNLSIVSRINNNDALVKPTNCRSDNLKTESNNFKGNIKDDIVKQEINSLNEVLNEGQFDNMSSSFDDSSNVTVSTFKQNRKTEYEEAKENLQDSYKIYFNYNNPEVSDDQKISNNEEINKPDLVDILIKTNTTDQQNRKLDNIKEKCNETVALFDEKSDFLQEKYLESAVFDKLSHENNLMYSEIIDDNESLTSKVGNNYTYFLEDKNKIDSECNLEELKTALKNIVKEENNNNNNNNSEIIKENVQKKNLKEHCSVEVNLNSSDGWDDFDFSDDEGKNIDQNEQDKNIQKEGKNLNEEQLGKNKAEVVKSKPLSGNIEVRCQKSKESVSSPTHLKENSVSEKKLSTKDLKNADLIIKKKKNVKEDHKKTEKKMQFDSIESKSACDDSWEWDNWDEIPNNKAKVEFKPTEKPPNKKSKEENSFDVSKWSGWDTFGQKPQDRQGNWNLGSWGMDVLLNKATAVTQGISNVIEAGLGAPDPETLLRLEKEERENLKEHEKEKSEMECEEATENSKKNSLTNVTLFPVSGITSLVAGVTSKIVEHSKIQEIGSKVITGGLDTLETFGKKTMEVLQEGDPGLKNKRALLLGNNKPVLSKVLKEAREKADKEMKKAEEKEIAKKCHFETLFDDFQGMVHLEALEMLSRQAELKLDQIKSEMNSEELEDLNGILEEVEQLCSLEEFNSDLKSSMVDFKITLQMAVELLKNEISIQKIIQILEDVNKWMKMATETKPSIILINQKLVSTLAELTAATVHQFHKSGELLSVKECRKTVEEVDALSKLTNVLCKEISRLGEKFLLLSLSTSMDNSTNVNSFNENVAVVVNNSMLYIRQAFNLLIPVIQLGAAV